MLVAWLFACQTEPSILLTCSDEDVGGLAFDEAGSDGWSGADAVASVGTRWAATVAYAPPIQPTMPALPDEVWTIAVEPHGRVREVVRQANLPDCGREGVFLEVSLDVHVEREDGFVADGEGTLRAFGLSLEDVAFDAWPIRARDAAIEATIPPDDRFVLDHLPVGLHGSGDVLEVGIDLNAVSEDGSVQGSTLYEGVANVTAREP